VSAVVKRIDAALALDALGREVTRLADELTSAPAGDDNAADCAALADLAAFLEYSACKLGGIPIAEDPRAAWLNEVCLCGCARGEHYVQAPHACEACTDAGGVRVCPMFLAAPAITERSLANFPSEPPPAADVEAS
jgi:hypothetical protein